MMGCNIHFKGVIWKIIPFTPSHLEHCSTSIVKAGGSAIALLKHSYRLAKNKSNASLNVFLFILRVCGVQCPSKLCYS